MTNPNRIAEMRKKRGLSQGALADKIGIHWVTLSKLERGKMQLTDGYLEQIADALDVGMGDLLRLSDRKREILVEGRITLNGETVEYEPTTEHLVTIPEETDEIAAFWMSVEGNSLWPLFKAGDLIRFVWCDEDETIHYLGRFVLLQAVAGVELVGRLEATLTPNRFDLFPMNGPPYRDIEVKRIAVADIARFIPPWTK